MRSKAFQIRAVYTLPLPCHSCLAVAACVLVASAADCPLVSSPLARTSTDACPLHPSCSSDALCPPVAHCFPWHPQSSPACSSLVTFADPHRAAGSCTGDVQKHAPDMYFPAHGPGSRFPLCFLSSSSLFPSRLCGA
ncbi:hypothetical protein BD310DRAFT_924800 [Dichomitus squalens]|uniref:Secreted protein n=1 Tax=Dichomitus squalens TaxID=114155 RepID=A0A4Q9PXM7_9APHY|nr:hypothetical protein BD310DRAFT_924800 [Dichomitus squalens]